MTTAGDHRGCGPPDWRCTCGASFDDYYGLAEHLRLSTACPRCGASPAAELADGELYGWSCGHWIMRGDLSATLRERGDVPTHYPTYGSDPEHVACACGREELIGDDGILAAVARVEEHARASTGVR